MAPTALENEPAPQRHTQSQEPSVLVVPSPEAIVPGTPGTRAAWGAEARRVSANVLPWYLERLPVAAAARLKVFTVVAVFEPAAIPVPAAPAGGKTPAAAEATRTLAK